MLPALISTKLHVQCGDSRICPKKLFAKFSAGLSNTPPRIYRKRLTKGIRLTGPMTAPKPHMKPRMEYAWLALVSSESLSAWNDIPNRSADL